MLLQVDSDVAHRESVVVFMSECCCRSTATWPIESVVLFMSELLLQVDSDVAHRESVVLFMSECCCRSTATWPIESRTEESAGWRHIRLQQTGKNASGQTHYLSLSGLEIYGTVTGVCDDVGTSPVTPPET